MLPHPRRQSSHAEPWRLAQSQCASGLQPRGLHLSQITRGVAFNESESDGHLVKPAVALDDHNQDKDNADHQQVECLVQRQCGSFGAWKVLPDQ